MADFASNLLDYIPQGWLIGQGANQVAGGGGEGDPPTVTDVSPPAGPLPTLTTPSAFTVQDVTGLAKVVIWVRYPSGFVELAYDGTSFSVGYGGSTVVTVTPTPPNTVARRFTIVRAGDWPANPDIEICGVDSLGNVT